MTITGTVHHIGQTEVISEKFSKRLLVVATEDKFDNFLPIQFTKDKTALLDGLQIGQSVSVEYNAGGREWQGKYFASNTGWKLTAGQQASVPTPQVFEEEENTTLPF